MVEVIKCATGTYTLVDSVYYTEECLFADTAIPKIKSKPPFELIQRKGEIELQLDIATFAFGVVNICTPQGQLLYSRTFTGERNLLISTSGFPNGSYIIQIKDNNTKKSWRRTVINLR